MQRSSSFCAARCLVLRARRSPTPATVADYPSRRRRRCATSRDRPRATARRRAWWASASGLPQGTPRCAARVCAARGLRSPRLWRLRRHARSRTSPSFLRYGDHLPVCSTMRRRAFGQTRKRQSSQLLQTSRRDRLPIAPQPLPCMAAARTSAQCPLTARRPQSKRARRVRCTPHLARLWRVEQATGAPPVRPAAAHQPAHSARHPLGCSARRPLGCSARRPPARARPRRAFSSRRDRRRPARMRGPLPPPQCAAGAPTSAGRRGAGVR